MQSLLLFVHVLIALVLMGLVMIQPSQGAHAGSAFGAGGASSVFGSQGSSSFLTKLTTYLALGFFATSLILAAIGNRTVDNRFSDESGVIVEEPVQISDTEKVKDKKVSNSEISDVPQTGSPVTD